MAATTDQLAITDSNMLMQVALRENSSTAIESADKVRKSRFAPIDRTLSAQQTRWGADDDKPYKPLPYIDMPVGLSDQEMDQFLRERRLEELTKNIRGNVLEDVDPDIRPPSPPPVYDRNGNRINSRETRIRKQMLNEQNRLVRYMMKHVPGYVAPTDFRPQKLAKKLILPLEKYPNAPFVQVIIGARGANHKKLQELTGCRIMIRGKGMDEKQKYQTDEDAELPQHVHIEADHEEQIAMAETLIKPLLNPETKEFVEAQELGLQVLAKQNGFTVALHEKRCGICQAIGHTSDQCPEADGSGWKMAEVRCAICGDRGHPTSDCPMKISEGIQENINWKAEAAKKMEADKLYAEMMQEFKTPMDFDSIDSAKQREKDFLNKARPGLGFSSSAGNNKDPICTEVGGGVSTTAASGAATTSGVAGVTTSKAGAFVTASSANTSCGGTAAGGPSDYNNDGRQGVPPASGNISANGGTSTSSASNVAGFNAPPAAKHAPQQINGTATAGANGADSGAEAGATSSGPHLTTLSTHTDYAMDTSLTIRKDLCSFFIGAKGANIHALKREAGCEINLERADNPDGTKTIKISGNTEQREKAKQLVLTAIEDAKQAQQVMAKRKEMSMGIDRGWSGSGGEKGSSSSWSSNKDHGEFGKGKGKMNSFGGGGKNSWYNHRNNKGGGSNPYGNLPGGGFGGMPGALPAFAFGQQQQMQYQQMQMQQQMMYQMQMNAMYGQQQAAAANMQQGMQGQQQMGQQQQQLPGNNNSAAG
ncbi:unnamed protein product [Amoebophrya sp. A120]|nr:unnamed protein product [Amoebophrya sp. A120]|eukprot:GSA120T00012361001.1